MGQTCCTDEPRDDAGTVQLTMDDEKQPVSMPASNNLMNGIRGHWTRKEDKMSLGTISSNSMVWEARYKHKPSAMWEVGPNKVKMTLANEDHTGTVSSSDNPLTITWEDGEVWVRTLP
ncbi:unnamed protein product [Symbiodinium sp. CCMP2592]|nr:unnamed protein product [Symbiodinium sp. CCMP2592]|mmetsp:Transcript_58790/g.137628  ORF Transcript_58790/g.137628 Transcript_58790/m.137628 type:complete len:118 (+) Transcript_58790:80-433(+)